MGQKFADSVGVSEPPLDINDSVSGIIKQVCVEYEAKDKYIVCLLNNQISTATRNTTSGSFVTYDGRTLPW